MSELSSSGSAWLQGTNDVFCGFRGPCFWKQKAEHAQGPALSVEVPLVPPSAKMFLCPGSRCCVFVASGSCHNRVISLIKLGACSVFLPAEPHQEDVLLWAACGQYRGWLEDKEKAKHIRHTFFFFSCLPVHSSSISALTHLHTCRMLLPPSVTDPLPPAVPLWVVRSGVCVFFSHTTPCSHKILPYKHSALYDTMLWA